MRTIFGLALGVLPVRLPAEQKSCAAAASPTAANPAFLGNQRLPKRPHVDLSLYENGRKRILSHVSNQDRGGAYNELLDVSERP